MFLCVAQNKDIFILGGIVIIVAYGFAAPAPPAIVSVGEMHGVESRRRVTTIRRERRCRLSPWGDSSRSSSPRSYSIISTR